MPAPRSSRPRRRRRTTAVGLAVGLAVAVGLSAVPATAASAADTADVSVDVTTDAIGQPWYGFGLQVQAHDDSSDIDPKHTTNPYAPATTLPPDLTDAQYAVLRQRIAWLRPGVARTNLTPASFCSDDACTSYDWDSVHMRRYYKVWDMLKDTGTTVGIGFWYTYPFDYTGSGFAHLVGDFFAEMHRRGYSNLKVYTGFNEPDCPFDKPSHTLDEWRTATRLAAKEFSDRSLGITIAGPDNGCSGYSDVPDAKVGIAAAADKDKDVVGWYSWHHYPYDRSGVSGTSDVAQLVSDGSQEAVMASYVDQVQAADGAGRPVGLWEMGCGCGRDLSIDVNPARTGFDYGLSMADYGVQVARGGASFGSAFTLQDLHGGGGWGAFDIPSGSGPYPWFTSWGLLTRYVRPGATLYRPAAPDGVRTLVARSPAGSGTSHWTVALVNRTSSDRTVRVRVPGGGSGTFQVYAYTPKDRTTDADGLPTPSTSVTGSLDTGLTVTVPAGAFVLATTWDGDAMPDGSFATSGSTLVPDGGLEAGSLQGWGTWTGSDGSGAGAAGVEAGGHTGRWRLVHWKPNAYEVYSDRRVDLADGTYTISAWVQGSGNDGGGTIQRLEVKDFDSSSGGFVSASIPGTRIWRRITLPGVVVQGGHATVGVYSKVNGMAWLRVDDVTYVRTS